MRCFIWIFIGVLFISCSQEEKPSEEENIEKILLNGEWKLVSSKEPFKRLQSGLKFSKDGQVFTLDSQGHVVPTHAECMYRISGDTLSLIDHKYVEQVRYEKGTDILVIKELTKNEMVFQTIHPGKPNELTFQNTDDWQ